MLPSFTEFLTDSLLAAVDDAGAEDVAAAADESLCTAAELKATYGSLMTKLTKEVPDMVRDVRLFMQVGPSFSLRHFFVTTPLFYRVFLSEHSFQSTNVAFGAVVNSLAIKLFLSGRS